jgi:hypothetical protein
MALYNTVDIKQLPQLEEVVNGNYLIVENDSGTNILDFVDFIVGPDNVSFYNVVESLSTRSVSMSATVDSKIQALSSDYYTRIKEASAFNLTTTQTVSSNIISIIKSVSSTAYPNIFYSYPDNDIVINVGNSIGTTTFSSPIDTIKLSDVNIIPSNFSSASAAWFISLAYVSNINYPEMPYTYTLTLETNKPISVDTAVFKVKIMKHYTS